MTRLRQMMLDELQRRNYAPSTIRSYIRAVEDFAKYFGRSPYRLGPDHIRQYQAHLFRDRKLLAGTIQIKTAAHRFLYVKTPRRHFSLSGMCELSENTLIIACQSTDRHLVSR